MKKKFDFSAEMAEAEDMVTFSTGDLLLRPTI